MLNSPHRFGTVARAFHWTVFLLFAAQYVGGILMSRVARNDTVLGWTQGTWYEWHKSIGLVVLLLTVARLSWRLATPMPDWSPVLEEGERRMSAWLERLLYLALLVAPLSGFVFVMAGGYGIKLFDGPPLPNPIGKVAWLEGPAHAVHLVSVWLAMILAAWHVGHVLKKHFVDQLPLLSRMLPFGSGDRR
ncbi:MAG: cytochrome b [Lautropia sp.]